LLGNACSLGMEGIIAKHRDSRYRSGRTGDWLKSNASKVKASWSSGTSSRPPGGRVMKRCQIFSAAALESENQKNQIDCRQPLMTGLALPGAPSFGASEPMLLQGGYGYGNILRLRTIVPL
jgi:hypothetical protein